MLQEIQTITLTIKDGQIQFDNMPIGYGVHVKNYDTELPEDTFLTQEEMEEDQLFKDEGGWFYSCYFAELSSERDPNQLELPVEGLD